MLELLNSIRETGYGIFILGMIGTVILMVVFKIGGYYVSRVIPGYLHEINVFKLLFEKSAEGRDRTEHIYLLILSCVFTLGSLMLTCTLSIVFQVVKMSDPNAYYPLVILFIATLFCLFGVIKGLDAINILLDEHIKRNDPADIAPVISKSTTRVKKASHAHPV